MLKYSRQINVTIFRFSSIFCLRSFYFLLLRHSTFLKIFLNHFNEEKIFFVFKRGVFYYCFSFFFISLPSSLGFASGGCVNNGALETEQFLVDNDDLCDRALETDLDWKFRGKNHRSKLADFPKLFVFCNGIFQMT